MWPYSVYDTHTHTHTQTGQFTLDMRCIRPRIPTVAMANDALLTTLVIENNLAICFCYAASDALSTSIECALEVTRCPIPQTITAEVEVSSLP